MEIVVTKNQKNWVEFTIKGERHTFPNLLKSRLAQDSDVEFVSYILEHPFDKDAKFVLKTNKKPAKKALEEACKSISSELSDFEKRIKQTIK